MRHHDAKECEEESEACALGVENSVIIRYSLPESFALYMRKDFTANIDREQAEVGIQ